VRSITHYSVALIPIALVSLIMAIPRDAHA